MKHQNGVWVRVAAFRPWETLGKHGLEAAVALTCDMEG
jgi:hypothetical protein